MKFASVLLAGADPGVGNTGHTPTFDWYSYNEPNLDNLH